MKVTQIELRGFSRTIAELEWLLLILTLLYFVAPSAIITDQWGVILAMVTFAAFIISFRYSRLFTEETRWKLAIETWAMIIFLSWVAYNTGGIDSPLLILYLIIIMVSALTLGKVMTLLEFILITVVYFYFSQSTYTRDSFSLVNFSEVMILFAPILLVGYVTTLLAADIQHANEGLALLSDTDELTGIKNRRAFNKEFSIEAKRAVRYERQFSIMMLDSDNLKKINDRYGHSVGDSLIISLSQVIKSNLRETDILARYGGDEFVVMLPETIHSKAIEIAERIRQSVENTSFSADGNRVSSTISIGVACYPEDSNISEDMIIKADRALYQSKLEGKNRVSG
jgi:diguanylate cyclase (GGDEF)-like protein